MDVLSTDAVKDMSLGRRNCLNHDEDLDGTGVKVGGGKSAFTPLFLSSFLLTLSLLKMDAFLSYSRHSCLLECRARHLFDECGCLPYYYPDFSAVWGKSTSCDFDGLKCIGGKTSALLLQ